MLVSTELLKAHTVVKSPISSQTVEKVKKLLRENPKQVCLFRVLNCFGDTLYKSRVSLTPKKLVLGKIIEQFLGITHQTLVDDFNKFQLLNAKERNEWITFCYFMKDESRIFLSTKNYIRGNTYSNQIYIFFKIEPMLANINVLLERFSEANRLSPINRKIIAKFLAALLDYPFLNKRIEQINEIPTNFWLYYFGSPIEGSKEIVNTDPGFISQINQRYSTLPTEACLTEIQALLLKSIALTDDQYGEIIAFIEEFKNDARYSPGDIVRLWDTCISLQSVRCLSVVEQCLRIDALHPFMAMLPNLEITPLIGKFSDENLACLIQYYEKMQPKKGKHSLEKYKALIDPGDKMSLDLAVLPFLNSLGFYQIMDWNIAYDYAMDLQRPKDILKLLINLQYTIRKNANRIFVSEEDLARILQRNNLMSKFFPEYSYATVLEALELVLEMGDTAFFAIHLLLLKAELDSYLFEFCNDWLSKPENLKEKLFELQAKGSLNPQDLGLMVGPAENDSKRKLLAYKNKNTKFQLLQKKYNHLNLYLDNRYTVYQCLEKLDERTRLSIANTWKLFESFAAEPSSPVISSLMTFLENIVTTYREPIIYMRGEEAFELILMELLLDTFLKRTVGLEGSYQKIKNIENLEPFVEGLFAQLVQENPYLLVSSKDLLEKLPPAGLSGTLSRLYLLLEKTPFISVLAIFHCFDEILMQEKVGFQLTDKWKVLDFLTAKYLGMSQQTLAIQLQQLCSYSKPNEQRNRVDDWIRICYLTRKVNLKGDGLLPLMQFSLPSVYEILKILSLVDDITEENLSYLCTQLNISNVQSLQKMSPALFTYHLSSHTFNLDKDIEENIEERYATLPALNLETKHKLLHQDENTYQEILLQWKQVKEDPRCPPLTSSENNKCFAIFLHLRDIDSLNLFEVCLRLDYLKKFIQAFDVEVITQNFAKFSDQNRIIFIEYINGYNTIDSLNHCKSELQTPLSQRDRFFAFCPQGSLTQKKIGSLEEQFFPL